MKEDIYAYTSKLVDQMIDLLPVLLLAITILLIGFVFAKLIERLIRKLLLYLDSKLNTVLQKRMVAIDLKVSARFISRTVFWIILVLTLLICFHILGLDVSSTIWFGKIIEYLPNILIAVVIVFVGMILGRLLGDLIKAAAVKTGLASASYFGRLVRYVILFVTIVIALDQLGVDIDFLKGIIMILLAGLLFGASLAFALGARTSVSNILGSYYIRKSHQVGKRIKIGNIEGIIIKISDHAVTVESESGLVIVPAKKFNEEESIIITEDQDGK